MKPVIWHVIFTPKLKEHWWGKRFGHVFLAAWTNETWVILDLQQKTTVLRVFYAFDETNDALSFLLRHYSVLRFGEAKESKSRFFQPMTCVTFVKHTLGVRSRALLPDQLFNDLVRKYDAEILNAAPKTEAR